MANVEGKVCLNHTNVPAASRCTTCMKPVCTECTVTVNAEDFCSQTCAENHIRTSAELSRFKSKQKSGLLKKIIILAILAGLAWFGWQNKDKILKFVDDKKEEMQKK